MFVLRSSFHWIIRDGVISGVANSAYDPVGLIPPDRSALLITNQAPSLVKSENKTSDDIYLSDKLWVPRVSDVILSDVSMKPVTEIQELVIQ